MATENPSVWFRYSQSALPWLLPWLLLFSRAIADFTVLLSGILFLLFSFRHREWEWAKKPWFRLCLVFWFYLLFVNLPLSVDPFDSLLYAITFMRWPLFAAALAYWLLAERSRQKHFLVSLLLTSLFIALDTGWQYLTGVDWFGIPAAPDNRLTGPLRNPVVGIMMVRVEFLLLFAVAVLASLQTPYRKVMYTSAILLAFLLLIFITGERMAFILCLSASLLVLLGLVLEYPARYKLVLLSGALLFFIILTLTFWLPETAQRMVFSSIEKLQNFRTSDYGQVFGGAIALWQHFPWFGSGLHTYQTVCTELGVMVNTGIPCMHPHNLYLHIAAETGAAGVGLFCLLVLGIFHQALTPLWQRRHWLLLAVSAAVLLLSFWPLIGGISILNNWVAALVWLGVGWTLAIADQYSASVVREEMTLRSIR